jgi:predicted phage baseplate assembly protein
LEPQAQPKQLLLLGDDGFGAPLAGSAEVGDTGAGRIEPDQGANEFAQALRTPVRVFGNLVRATRGESVVNVVLGSGNAALAFQKFALGKTPLTYLNDPAAPDGRRSTLQIRVNGLLWREVPSFFGVGSDEEVYIVRRNPETGQTVITFGDGQTGARPPTGVNNIVANYRFGAGAAAPPANSITQLARPVLGIRGAENPVPAGGGADGDRPKDLRRNASDSALLLGRAVSLQDFEALAREFGVINARADWTWDRKTQRAVVKVWFIPNGDASAETNESELKATLLGQADPNTPLVARQAEAVPAELIVDLIVHPRFNSDEVELAVAETLTDPEFGLLALENIPIGGPLFRSAIFEQVLSVNGVESVRALTVNGKRSPAVLQTKQGRFYNFLPQLIVGNTAAGDILFAKAQAENLSNLAAFTTYNVKKPAFASNPANCRQRFATRWPCPTRKPQ